MTFLKTFFQKLVKSGLTESDLPALQKKVVFFNQFLFFNAFVSILYVFIFALEQNYRMSLMCVWAVVFISYLFFLNSRRFFTPAMFLMLMNACFCVGFASFILEPSSGAPAFFFVMICFPFFLFSACERAWMTVSYMTILGCFLLVWFFRGPFVFYVPFNLEGTNLIFYAIQMSIFIFFIFLSFFYVRFESNLARVLFETTTSLQQDNKSAQDSLSHHERIGKLSLSIAHEIKNPVSAILATCELYHSEKELDLDRFNMVVKKNIQRLLTVTNSMLSFGEVSYSSEEEFQINTAIDEILYLVEPMAKKTGVTIVRKYSEFPSVKMDTIRFHQVILNLVINAIEAMKDGGQLTISTKMFKYESGDDWIEIEVHDTGSGIGEADLERIFTSYVTMKKGNTGLGLYVVKENMEFFNGKVTVESDPDSGSLFSVQFPRKQEKKEENKL